MIPTNLNLLGIDIPVVLKPESQLDRSDKLHGYYDRREKKIYINEEDTHETQVSTLCHEVLHALLALSHHREGLDEDTEERLVAFLEDFYVPQVLTIYGIKCSKCSDDEH